MNEIFSFKNSPEVQEAARKALEQLEAMSFEELLALGEKHAPKFNNEASLFLQDEEE